MHRVKAPVWCTRMKVWVSVAFSEAEQMLQRAGSLWVDAPSGSVWWPCAWWVGPGVCGSMCWLWMGLEQVCVGMMNRRGTRYGK